MAPSEPPVPRLTALATAVPAHVLDQKDVMQAGRTLFGSTFGDIERLMPVYGHAGIERRFSCMPLDWYLREHGFAERNTLYLEHAVALLIEAAGKALDEAGLAAQDIDTIVVVSTSGIATPSLDALLMEAMPLRRDVMRLPVFGLGCAGGVMGLARAAALAQARPGSRVLYLCAELCGLTFRHADKSKSNFVATALFGDGAAAAVVTTDAAGPRISAWGEHTWPQSLDVMGWNVADDGLGVVFSRDIPTWVRERFRGVADAFLARNGLTVADVDKFLCHPGGAKVVDALEEAFGLDPGALKLSRDVLRDYGNMSAATVLFVLQRALEQEPAGTWLLSSLGPGFTAAFLTLEAR